jgi:hypothetical protein
MFRIAILLVATAVTASLANTTVAQDAAPAKSGRTVSILGTELPEGWEKHPLGPAPKMAYEGYRRISEEVDDYTCTFVKRERINGELRDFEYIATKVRHEQKVDGRIVVPFAVHLKFLGPERVEGREVLFIEGQNDGKMFARRGGLRFGYMAARIDPAGDMAMRDNRYPITQMGMLHLVRQLVERAEGDLHYGECEAKFFRGSKINGRSCTEIKVTHPIRRDHFHYHLARILIDDELRVPIHYEAYDWPGKEGDPPPLTESYSYLDLKLNVGLTDRDFDYRNPDYGFEYLNRQNTVRDDVGFSE